MVPVAGDDPTEREIFDNPEDCSMRRTGLPARRLVGVAGTIRSRGAGSIA